MKKPNINIRIDTRFLCIWFIFLVLKLTNVIDWSWWVIFSPMIVAIIMSVVSVIIFFHTYRKYW